MAAAAVVVASIQVGPPGYAIHRPMEISSPNCPSRFWLTRYPPRTRSTPAPQRPISSSSIPPSKSATTTSSLACLHHTNPIAGGGRVASQPQPSPPPPLAAFASFYDNCIAALLDGVILTASRRSPLRQAAAPPVSPLSTRRSLSYPRL